MTILCSTNCCKRIRIWRLDNEFRRLLDNRTILGNSCTDKQLLAMERRLPQLDYGELEAICIINKCSDKTFKPYVLLTDDNLAQKKLLQ